MPGSEMVQRRMSYSETSGSWKPLPELTNGFRRRFSRQKISNLIHHPAERWMRPILHLDPAVRPAAAVDAVAMLGDQTLQPHQAGVGDARFEREPSSPIRQALGMQGSKGKIKSRIYS